MRQSESFHWAAMDLVGNRLWQNQIRFGFVGKEIPNVAWSGESDRGGFLYAVVSDVAMDYLGRMSHGYAPPIEVLVLAEIA